MATAVFSAEELDALRRYPPEIASDELIRFFTLMPGDLAFVNGHRGAENRLGVAMQLCTLPWLGFVPDVVTTAPRAAVERVAATLGLPPIALSGYGVRDQTRTDHLRGVAAFLGWRQGGELEFKELDQFLLARAMERDSPALLFRLACEQLRSARVIRPGPVWLSERVGAAREAAKAETYARVAHLLTPRREAELDALLEIDPVRGSSMLHWLNTGATQASPEAIKAEIDKLRFLRGIGADELDLSSLPVERRRFLAGVGRRSTPQMLARRVPERKHPILLTVVSQAAVEVLDEVVQLFDQAVSAREAFARRRLTDTLAERAVRAEDRLGLLDDMLPVLLDPAIPAEEVGPLLRGLGLDRIRAAQVLAQSRLPRDRGHLALLQESFSYLRRFVPRVLDAVDFAGTDGDLLAAVAVLRDLYAKGRRNVPGDAPTSFVPARWLGYLEQAQRDGDATGYRHYWELCVLYGLRDGLRSGDVHVPGSRRYADPAEYLLDADRWGQLREEYCAQNGKPRAASEAIELARAELHSALDDLEAVLAAGDGPVRLDDDGALIIGRLTAESVPDEAEALLDDLAAMLPRIPLAALLIELDRRCRKGIVTGTAADAAPSTLGLTGITDERTPSTTP